MDEFNLMLLGAIFGYGLSKLLSNKYIKPIYTNSIYSLYRIGNKYIRYKTYVIPSQHTILDIRGIDGDKSQSLYFYVSGTYLSLPLARPSDVDFDKIEIDMEDADGKFITKYIDRYNDFSLEDECVKYTSIMGEDNCFPIMED